MLTVLQAEDMTCLLNYGPAEQAELQMLQPEAELQHSWACSMYEALFEHGKGELRNLGLSTSQAQFVYALSLVRSRTFSEEVRLHCRPTNNACHLHAKEISKQCLQWLRRSMDGQPP